MLSGFAFPHQDDRDYGHGCKNGRREECLLQNLDAQRDDVILDECLLTDQVHGRGFPGILHHGLKAPGQDLEPVDAGRSQQ